MNMFQRISLCLILSCATFLLIPAQHYAQSKESDLADPSKLIIHYHRYDGNYSQASLWTWDGRNQKDPENPEIFYSGETDFGVYFVVDPSLYGDDDSQKERIGFIPRLNSDWNQKDGGDRFWTPSMGNKIWLIGNNPKIFTEEPDISPKIVSASIDGPNTITVKVSHPMKEDEVHSERFIVKHADGSVLPLRSAAPLNAQGGETYLAEIKTEYPLDFLAGEYEVSTIDYRAATTKPRDVLFDPSLFRPQVPMGAQYSPEATTFRIFSPLARSVSVVLFDDANESGRQEYPMKKIEQGAWEVTIDGDLEGKHYRLAVDTETYGLRVVNDPYATNTVGDDAPARITDIRAQDPDGFRPVNRPPYGDHWTDAIIYEIHVRDFTIDENSGVEDDKRGKYLGFVQEGTVHPADNSIKTGIDHLKELGVTHVQILPIQDFDNDEDNTIYNWGYMTAFFDSPEGWFASEIRGPARVREYKELIKGLHDAGIRVIMDVVYNHTGTQNTFESVAPGYFLRKRPDGSFYNGSGTGNEFHSEAPMGRKFVIESCKYWVEEYGVDGFRFDLMGLMDLGTLQELKYELRSVYPDIMLYGEPWAGNSETGIQRVTFKDVVRGSGLAAFNDHYRNAIKGSPDGDDPGYVVNGSNRDMVRRGLMGSIDDWAAQPWESINYATCHDNLTLWDKFLASAPDASDEEMRRMQNLTAGILAVSQGILFYHAGVEMARTKGGDHNSYSAPDSVNMIDWTRKKTYNDVYQYHQGVIALRKAHPLFRLPTAGEIRDRFTFQDFLTGVPETIAFTIDGRGVEDEAWREAAVFINPTASPVTFRLPSQEEYQVFVHDQTAGTEPIMEIKGEIEVPARSMSVLGR